MDNTQLNDNAGWLRDIVGMCAIWIAVAASTLPLAFHGMNGSDGSQIFHFANKLLHGFFPYRDYVYQIGFVPIILDALFQAAFGERFLSSVVSLFIVRIGVITFLYLIARQFTSVTVATLAAAAAAFLFPALYQGGAHYLVEFLLFASVYALIAGFSKCGGRFLYGVAGALLAGIIAVRQPDGLFILASCVGVLICLKFRFKNRYRTRLLAFHGGVFICLLILAGILIFNAALGEAVKQLFVDAPAKKQLSWIAGLADAASGGATGFASLFRYDILPTCAVACAAYLLWKRGPTAIALLAPLLFVLVGIGVCWQQVQQWRFGTSFDPYLYANALVYDLPRVFFCITIPVAIIWPNWFENTLRLPVPEFCVIGASTLGAVWARQLSWPGRGLTDNPILICATILVLIMCTGLSNSSKSKMLTALLCVAVGGFCVRAETGRQITAYEGFVHENAYSADHPILAGISVSRQKVEALAFLTRYIKGNESCFVFGSAPVLYTLLNCRNVTRIDSTYSDFFTAQDGAGAAADLVESKPTWIVDKPNEAFPYPLATPVSTILQAGPSQATLARAVTLRLALQHLTERDYTLVARLSDFLHERKVAAPLAHHDFDWVAEINLYKKRM
jgi:hypothetical protein